MSQTIEQSTLFSEANLFSQGVLAGEFIFLAQDARGSDGMIGAAQSAEQQTRLCLFNLDIALHALGQSTADVVSLSVFLSDYRDAATVAKTLRERFGNDGPAVNFVGVCALEGGCHLRMDAIATTSEIGRAHV